VRARSILLAIAVLMAGAHAAYAQAFEVVPFGGYRFGGGFNELVTGEEVDVDGAVAVGGIVNIPFRDLQIEALFTRQQARFTLPVTVDPAGTRWKITVDHYQLGGLRELSYGRARPFLTGTLGLTRYESDGDNEIRFSLAGGGGVKLYPTRHLGLRLDGRLYLTFVDVDGDSLFCSSTLGVCIGSIDAVVVWQAEFTAGLIIQF
jgi:hypothetical protein